MSINKKQILDSWKKLQKDVNKFVKDQKVDDLQKSVKDLVASAQKDLHNLYDKDVAKVKSKIKKEALYLEKKIEKVVNAEIKKAKKFVDGQKKELNKLQSKLEKMVPKKKAA